MLGGLSAAAVPALAASYTYALKADPVAEGLWVVRGADDAILPANGGAIANITILDTREGAVLVDAGPSLRYGTALAALAKSLTGKAVARVYITHLHPDHSYGDAAFPPERIAATQAAIDDLTTEGRAFSDGMYRLLGDWMRGTELHIPGHVITTPTETIGGRTLTMLPLAGHSAADLAIYDQATKTLIAGDLVFHDRAPSTPVADLVTWRTSLTMLKGVGQQRVVPGHGLVDATPATAIDQTRDWLDWLEGALAAAIDSGLNPVEAGEIPLPARFARMKAARYELQRSVSHFYPGLEQSRLPMVGNRS